MLSQGLDIAIGERNPLVSGGHHLGKQGDHCIRPHAFLQQFRLD